MRDEDGYLAVKMRRGRTTDLVGREQDYGFDQAQHATRHRGLRHGKIECMLSIWQEGEMKEQRTYALSRTGRPKTYRDMKRLVWMQWIRTEGTELSTGHAEVEHSVFNSLSLQQYSGLAGKSGLETNTEATTSRARKELASYIVAFRPLQLTVSHPAQA